MRKCDYFTSLTSILNRRDSSLSQHVRPISNSRQYVDRLRHLCLNCIQASIVQSFDSRLAEELPRIDLARISNMLETRWSCHVAISFSWNSFLVRSSEIGNDTIKKQFNSLFLRRTIETFSPLYDLLVYVCRFVKCPMVNCQCLRSNHFLLLAWWSFAIHIFRGNPCRFGHHALDVCSSQLLHRHRHRFYYICNKIHGFPNAVQNKHKTQLGKSQKPKVYYCCDSNECNYFIFRDEWFLLKMMLFLAHQTCSSPFAATRTWIIHFEWILFECNLK